MSDPDAREAMARFAAEYEAAIEAGREPPDSAPLLTSLDPADQAALLQLLERFRKRPPRPPEGLPGAPRVPGYRIVAQIACGGMGVVYRAHQAPTDRVVALKVLPAGQLAPAAERERFRREGAALSSFQHPGIVTVYEVGDADGVPFLSMEFCPGGSLADQLLDKKPRAAAAAAGLIRTVAAAVQAAHDAALIHRDLKPGNILFAADGTPKVSDFGLVHIHGERGVTQTGAAVGTPSYMAPEQAAGTDPVTSAADVYALGAILYELLTAHPPFLGTTALETLDLVRSGAVVAVRQLNPGVPHDLETICLHALNPDPTRRYPTPRALADDLSRFLSKEAIAARPVGSGERMVLWCRRNPVVAGLLATVAVLFLVGTPALVYLWRQAEREAKIARTNEGIARDRQQRADRLTRDILSQANTIGRLQASLPDARAVLDTAAQHLETLAAETADDPSRAAEVAGYYFQIGRTRYALSQLPEAEAALERTAAFIDRLGPVESLSAEVRHTKGQCLHLWGVVGVLQDQRRAATIEPRWEAARGVLEPIAEEHPPARLTLAVTWLALGNCASIRFRPDEAERRYDSGLAQLDALPEQHRESAPALDTRAQLLQMKGRLQFLQAGLRAALSGGADKPTLAQSEKLHDDAEKVCVQLIRIAPDKPEYKVLRAAGLNHAANTLRAKGDLGPAADRYREALGLYRPLVLAFPAATIHKQEMAGVLANLNQVYAGQKRWAEAEGVARESVEHFTLLTRTYPRQAEHRAELGIACELLARTIREQGRKPEADDADFRAAEAFAVRAGMVERSDPGAPKIDADWSNRALGVLRRLERDGYFRDAAKVTPLRGEAFGGLSSRSEYADFLRKLGVRFP